MSEAARPLKVLLIDDEEDFLSSTSRPLRRRGFEVEVAPNGVTALELIARQAFDAIVLDVKMPDIDGLELFRQIRIRCPGLPILLLTGRGSIDDAFQTSKDGAADYLSKPIEIDDLAERVRRAVAPAEGVTTPPEVAEAILAGGEVIRVMLVDDEREFLESMRKVLARRRFEVVTAADGQEALDRLQESLVDVVVLDVKMPGMDGLEVLRRLRERHPGLQVILLSGHPSIETATRGIRLGASEYLQKPPKLEELVETIRRLYGERRAAILEEQQKLIDEIRRRYPD